MAAIRVYADTSVYGGAFDEEFADASRTFFDQVEQGRFRLIVSPIVHDELEGAPESVRALFERHRGLAENVDITADVIQLQQAYMNANIVGPKWETDALHVATATVYRCSLIVSWNFQHIVNFQKIPLYNGVNLAHGYGNIGIHIPQEVVLYEDEDI